MEQQPIRTYTDVVHGQTVTVRRFAAPTFVPNLWCVPKTKGYGTDPTFYEDEPSGVADRRKPANPRDVARTRHGNRDPLVWEG